MREPGRGIQPATFYRIRTPARETENTCRLAGRFVELTVRDAKRNGESEYEAQYVSFVRDR
jgi:hypothetical protein